MDVREAIGRFPKPRGSWTPGNYKYLGLYNPVDEQERMDDVSGVSEDDFDGNPTYIDEVYRPP